MAGIFDQFLSGYESGDALRQQREQEKKRGLLSQYASQAMSAPREQRAGLLGQIAAVDPSAAYDAQKHFGEMDERTRADLGRSLAVFSSLPDEEKAAAYPEIAQRAHSIGMPVPTEYKPEFGPRMAQLAQILSGGEQQDATPSAIRELQMLQSNPELLALDMKRRQAGWQPQRITDDDGNLYWATPGGPVVPAEVGMSDSPGNDDVYPGGDIYSAVEQVESGGNPYAVSPAGAIGPMQTMPGTLRDPGFGVAPARSNSVDEQRRVGQDYLDAMIAQYGPEGGLAAYNWGPGNWQAALKRTDGNVQAALALAPKETRDYVPKVQRRLGGGSGPTFGSKRKDAFATLSPEEVRALGLPEGTVAQRSPQGQVQIVNKPRDLPTGGQVIDNGDGTTTFIPAGKITEGERNAAGFYQRMVAANDELRQLESAGYDPTNLRDFATTGRTLTNFAASPEGQQYYQAAMNWVRANLRKESGAAIGVDEARQEIRNYFPQPGDSRQVIEQKRRNREVTERAMRQAAGGALPPPQQRTAQPSAPSGGGIDDLLSKYGVR